jgi:N-acetylmuramoyl-L-alanine amidase
VVVLDAGHGGIDPGTTAANGALEKDVVLLFAQALRQRLLKENRFRVVMIRDDDTFVPLDERVRRAREAGANLFVSIHADSIGVGSVRGATVYTGAERATDAESAKLADRENAADAAAGLPAEGPALAVSDILHDLTARETRRFSHRFAHLLLSDMGRATRWSAQPHREAGFRVLRAHDVPAVLVELGYLSNAKDADLLGSEPWRERASAAMAGAVTRFFGGRPSSHAAMSP